MTYESVTDIDPEAVILSLDGVGAYDHVRRAEFLQRLLDVEGLRPLRPLLSHVRSTYDRTSRYVWTDNAGVTPSCKAKGGNKGTP